MKNIRELFFRPLLNFFPRKGASLKNYTLSYVTKKEFNEKNSIACTDISNTVIYNNYQFSLFLSEYPVFSLKLDKENSEYRFTSRNNTKVAVNSSTELGRATMKDANLLLYCISKLCQLNYEKKPITRRVSFTAYNYLKEINKTISGRSYYQLIDSLNRLASTKLVTNRKIARLEVGGGLGLIENFYCDNDKNGKLKKIEVLLPEWLFAEISLRKIITINPGYLKLSPFEKKLYQLAKTHCRNNLPGTEFSLDYFIKKVGSLEISRNFKSRVRKLQNSQVLPDFSINYENDKIRFTSHKQNKDDVADTVNDKIESKELKQNISQQNTQNTQNIIRAVAQKFNADQNVMLLQSKLAIKRQVASVKKELDMLYPKKNEAIFKSDVLTDNKIYSYIKEFGAYHFLKTVRKNINFDFRSVNNPGGYLWKVMKNSRK